MRFCVVRLAINGPRRARRTAEPERFELLRIADRPTAHTGANLHEFDRNPRRERRGIIRALPIDNEFGTRLPPTAEPAIVWESFNTGDSGHFAFAAFSLGYQRSSFRAVDAKITWQLRPAMTKQGRTPSSSLSVLPSLENVTRQRGRFC